MFVLHVPMSIDNFRDSLVRGLDVSDAPVFRGGGDLELPPVSQAIVRDPTGADMGNPLIDIRFNCRDDAWDWFMNHWAPMIGSGNIYEWDCLLGAGRHMPP